MLETGWLTDTASVETRDRMRSSTCGRLAACSTVDWELAVGCRDSIVGALAARRQCVPTRRATVNTLVVLISVGEGLV